MSNFGLLAMYSLWWCGLGAVIFRLTMSDYCESCYYIEFMRQSKSRKTFSLLVEDTSQLEMPPVHLEDLKKKLDENLVAPA